MDFSEIKEYLIKFSVKYDLIPYAKESCLVTIKNCIDDNGIDELGGYSQDELILEFDHQELVFNDWMEKSPYIKTRIGIYIKDEKNIWVRGLQPIGYYELDTDENGNHFDDLLIFN